MNHPVYTKYLLHITYTSHSKKSTKSQVITPETIDICAMLSRETKK